MLTAQPRRIAVRALTALALVVALLLPLDGLTRPAGAVEYDMQFLGRIPGFLNTIATAMNDNGVVVGWGQEDDTLALKAWTWSEADGFTVLPDLPDPGPYRAIDINDAGVIAGDGGYDSGQAWRFSAGAYEMLGTIGGDPISVAAGINADGDIAGSSRNIVLSDPAEVFFAPVGGPLELILENGTAGGINDADQIAGWSSSLTAFRHTPGVGVEFLPFLDGKGISFGGSINESGDVVGTQAHANGNADVPFMYSDEFGLEEIGSFGGGAGSAWINDVGQVVGNLDLSGVGTPWIWTRDQGVRFFSDLVDPSLNIGLLTVTRITNSGQVIGFGIDNDTFVTGPVLLTPSGAAPGPVAAFSASCTGLACEFDGGASTGTGLAYDWDFGDGATGTGVTASHSYDGDGAYLVSLTVTDDTGATDTTSQSITVAETAATAHVSSIDVVLTERDDRARGDATVTILDQAGVAAAEATVTGDWLLNGSVVEAASSGTTGTDGTVQLSSGRMTGVTTGDVIEFCVTDVTHPSLTYDPAANVVDCGSAVVGGATGPVASFTLTCALLACDVDASASTGTGLVYDWDFGDGTTGTGVTAGHTYAASGTYTVSLTVTDDTGLTDVATQDVTVTDSAPATIHVADLSVSLTVRDTRARGTAVVAVADEAGAPVADATVSGDWLLNGVFIEAATGTTGTDGTVSLTGRITGIASGDLVEFCITEVSHAALAWDPAADVAGCGAATVP